MAEASLVTATAAPPIAIPRASGLIFKNCMPEPPVRELPKVGKICACARLHPKREMMIRYLIVCMKGGKIKPKKGNMDVKKW
jgi:hypothetical protein